MLCVLTLHLIGTGSAEFLPRDRVSGEFTIIVEKNGGGLRLPLNGHRDVEAERVESRGVLRRV